MASPGVLEVSQRPLLQIIHGALRHANTETEKIRAKECVDWIRNNQDTFWKTCTKDEKEFLTSILDFRDKFDEAATQEHLDQYLKQLGKSPGVQEILINYVAEKDSLVEVEATDMSVYFNERVISAENSRVSHCLARSMQILVTGWEDPKKRVWKGSRDALEYVSVKLNEGIISIDSAIRGGLASEHRDFLFAEYEKRRIEAESGLLKIPTGIGPLDLGLKGGLDRESFYGVIGFAGQGKSTAVRTIAYNAASAGFRVLHIPLETSFSEELIYYYVMHAHAHAARLGECKISAEDLRNGTVDPQVLKVFKETIAADFVADYAVTDSEGNTVDRLAVGKNLDIRDVPGDHSWANVRSFIERLHALNPYDLVIVDYLTLCKPNGAHPNEERIAVSHAIKDVKRMLLHGMGDHKVAFITPVQGSRDGKEDAEKNGGYWESSGIWNFSEFDKSLDCLIGVFTTTELNQLNKAKMCVEKNRRGKSVLPFDVNRLETCGMFSSAAVSVSDVPSSPKTAATPTQNFNLGSLHESLLPPEDLY